MQMEIKIKMPEDLKSYIVDDWEQICKHKADSCLSSEEFKNKSV